MTTSEKPTSLLRPALEEVDPFRRADLLSRLAAEVGFDWPSAESALEKAREELEELGSELQGGTADAIEQELGDLLFAVCNVARKCGVDPADAIARTNTKFVQRFNEIENRVHSSGRDWDEFTLDEFEEIWLAAKK